MQVATRTDSKPLRKKRSWSAAEKRNAERTTLVQREHDWTNLMRAALDGDTAAYRRFLNSVAPALRSVIHRHCVRFGINSSDAEDILQETLLAVHLKRHTWDVTRPIGPWILAISRYKFIDYCRRRNVPAISSDAIEEIAEADERETTLDGVELEQALETLDPRQRALIRSISIDGHSIREVSERLNMTYGATRVALHRAIKALAKLVRAGKR